MTGFALGKAGGGADADRFKEAFASRAAMGRHGFSDDPALWSGMHATANLADVLHYLCVLHGRHPGVIDLACERGGTTGDSWLSRAAKAFAVERAFLARLVAEAGPLPSTACQAESEAAVLGQRHALEMLSRSDRAGCAAGCAGALLIAWTDVRQLLDRGARRLGVAIPSCDLPADTEVRQALASTAATPALERAVLFGAEQMFVQQHGFWDLMATRCASRRAAG